jgi:hypothetical protein
MLMLENIAPATLRGSSVEPEAVLLSFSLLTFMSYPGSQRKVDG